MDKGREDEEKGQTEETITKYDRNVILVTSVLVNFFAF